eukprot:7382247-Prymnesium_polylepis.3
MVCKRPIHRITALQPRLWVAAGGSALSNVPQAEAAVVLRLMLRDNRPPRLLWVATDETANRRGEYHEQHHAQKDAGPGGHVAAVVAARLQLVKVSGVGRPRAQFASRPSVPRGTVAIATVASADAATARGPPTIARLARIRLDCSRRVAPKALFQLKRRDGGVDAAPDAADSIAR